MKHLRLFKDREEYNAADLEYPTLSLIQEDNSTVIDEIPPTIIAKYVFEEDIPAGSYPFYQETTMSSKVTSFKVNGVETFEEKPLVVLGTYTPIATGISEELEGPIFTEESLITGAERVRIIFSKKPDILGLYIEGMGNAATEISEWIDLFGLEVVSDTEYILNLLAVASQLGMDYSELTITIWGCGNIDNPEGAVEEINSFNTIIETISGGYTTSGNQEGWQAGEYEVIIHLDRRYPTITELFKLNLFIREVKLLGNFNNFDTSFTFNGCSLLETADLSKSNLKELGESLFSDCSNLISINLPEELESSGGRAFSGCSSLTSIVLPESVTSIGSNAFFGCSSLTDITIPESVTSIEDGAFSGCENLTDINIPESVTSIGSNALSGCNNLKSITIPEGVKSIGEGAFSNCTGLTAITIPKNVTSIENRAFSGCTSLTAINIPEGVISIGSSAFSHCSSLTEINIPESVTSIGEYAFYGCTSLTDINIPENVTEIGNFAFWSCSLTAINIPENSKLTSIGEYAFSACRSLTSINIPESVISIGSSAFDGCWSLASINIPESVTSIEENVFSYCTSLTAINIPESVTSIGGGAFNFCRSLTSITIPEAVKSIGSFSFQHCISMTHYDFSLHTSVPSLGRDSFKDISSTCQIRVPSALYDEWIVAEGWVDIADNIHPAE